MDFLYSNMVPDAVRIFVCLRLGPYLNTDNHLKIGRSDKHAFTGKPNPLYTPGQLTVAIHTGQISRMSTLCPGNLNLVRYLLEKNHKIKIIGTQFWKALVWQVSIAAHVNCSANPSLTVCAMINHHQYHQHHHHSNSSMRVAVIDNSNECWAH
jgi:hypothetical protein